MYVNRKRKYLLNWHYILFGPVNYVILLFALYETVCGGQFIGLAETIRRIQNMGGSDQDTVEAFVGLFLTGLFLNFLISFFKFKGNRVSAFAMQFWGLLTITVGVTILLLTIGIIIKAILIVFAVVILWDIGNDKRTRADAFLDLAYRIKGNESLTEDRKRNIEALALSAALDDNKDDHDTKDIDDIGTRYGL